MLRRALRILLALAALALLVLGAGYAYISHPTLEHNPLPGALIDGDSPEGQSLESSAIKADLPALRVALQPQEKRSWCGVASAATALSALRGAPLRQSELLRTSGAGWFKVSFAGMSLDTLATILVENGARAEAVHASDSTVEGFRAALDRDLADPADALLVNYDRRGLGQRGGGHISPIGAWDPASDRVLILDVSTLRYPPVWVGSTTLFAAMGGIDPGSGLSRGWVELSLAP